MKQTIIIFAPSSCGACWLQQEPGATTQLHFCARRGPDYAAPGYNSNGYPDGSNRESCPSGCRK